MTVAIEVTVIGMIVRIEKLFPKLPLLLSHNYHTITDQRVLPYFRHHCAENEDQEAE